MFSGKKEREEKRVVVRRMEEVRKRFYGR